MMMLNTVTQSAGAAARNADSAQPAQAASDATGAAQPTAAQLTAAQPNAAQPGAPSQPFAAWLDAQSQVVALTVQANLPADGAAVDATPQAGDAAAATPDKATDDGAGAGAAQQPQDGALLAAMAMPLMPLTPVQVAQAVQAAQPSGAQSGDDTKSTGATAAVTAAGADGRRAATPDRALALPPAVDTASAPAARQVQPEAVPAVRLAVHAQADAGATNSGGQDAGSERGGAGNAAPAATPDRAALAGAIASQPAPNAAAADTVKLAGPPTAWRQSLQEALGQRMNVQVGNGIEQAVIRLEPPQLGRIDIAIRHNAGALEVNISASNSEVLRQLQTVSDNLRSDLSQRQFTEVAVTVAPAPKNGAAPFGDPQQGRGRQQDREQEDNQPGRALAEAGNNSSAFTLGGRD
jgi:flagellar hook-length control protein FliK